jgi:hypothetical protein
MTLRGRPGRFVNVSSQPTGLVGLETLVDIGLQATAIPPTAAAGKASPIPASFRRCRPGAACGHRQVSGSPIRSCDERPPRDWRR